jgi:hypothetical protein
MIHVRVRQEDGFDFELFPGDKSEQVVDLVAGVDEDGLTGGLAADDEPVLEEWRSGSRFDDHQSRIAKPP